MSLLGVGVETDSLSSLARPQQGKPYSVYSPYQRSWLAEINSHLGDYMHKQNGPVIANASSVRDHALVGPMFAHEVPTSLAGFELEGGDDEAARMRKLWPVGDGVVDGIMRRFLRTKMQPAKFFEAPLESEGNEVDDPKKKSKIGEYCEGRNRVDWDGTSHIRCVAASSPSLVVVVTDPNLTLGPSLSLSSSSPAVPTSPPGSSRRASASGRRSSSQAARSSPAGATPASACGSRRSRGATFTRPCVPLSRSLSPTELRWGADDLDVLARPQVLVAWPRVCMNRPYNLKYDGTLEWAEDEGGEKLKAWKEGKTGFPIVDAAMRSLKEQGCASPPPPPPSQPSAPPPCSQLVPLDLRADTFLLVALQTCTTAAA